MGLLLQSQGKLDETMPYWREALEGRRRVLGDDHPNTLLSISNMGFLLQSQGKLDEAMPYFREALEGRRRVLGDDHPDTLGSINSMGFFLQSQGKLDEAMPYFREALEVNRRAFGDQHPRTLLSISNMARLLVQIGSATKGERLAREAVTGGRDVLGASHWLFGNFLGKHGYALKALERFGEAEKVLLEGNRILVTALGSEHTQTTRVYGYLVDLYESWHAAEPGKGYDAKAEQWRAKLPID